MITHLLVSSLAAAALIGLWVANPLESTADTVSDTGDSESQERTRAVDEQPVVVASADIRNSAIPEVTISPPVEVVPLARAAAAVAPIDTVSLVEVPDVKKLSVWEARKQLKKQGLRFAFKRGSRRVRHEDFDYYRVKKQSLSAGEQVAAGTKVTLQVREIRYASGY